MPVKTSELKSAGGISYAVQVHEVLLDPCEGCESRCYHIQIVVLLTQFIPHISFKNDVRYFKVNPFHSPYLSALGMIRLALVVATARRNYLLCNTVPALIMNSVSTFWHSGDCE